MGSRGFSRTAAAGQLYDVLEPLKIASGILDSVYADSDDGWLVLNTAANNSLNLRVDADDDTIWIMDGPHLEDGMDVSGNDVWRTFIGQELTGGWLAMNRRGYIDSVLLGFGNVIPDVCLSVMGSTLGVNKFSAWQRASTV